jgi:hypothetical protein
MSAWEANLMAATYPSKRCGDLSSAAIAVARGEISGGISSKPWLKA